MCEDRYPLYLPMFILKDYRQMTLDIMLIYWLIWALNVYPTYRRFISITSLKMFPLNPLLRIDSDGKKHNNIIPKQRASSSPMKAKWYVLFRTEFLQSAQPFRMQRQEIGSIVLVRLCLISNHGELAEVEFFANLFVYF